MKFIQRSLMGMGMLMLCTGGAVADDGTIFRRNVSSTQDLETEFAAIRMLPLYVPAQSTDETLLENIEYTRADGAIAETREFARPLIAHYTDGHVTAVEDGGGFPGHGERDAFGAVSLDDGATWKRTNLSKSADLSSFKIKTGTGRGKWVPYPGDVGRTSAASDGNKVLIAWVSRYCGGGSPNYAMIDVDREAVATYLGLTAADCTDLFNDDGTYDLTTPCYYLEDYFGVAGSQGSSDLADEGYPAVGVLPYACVWTARGVLNPPSEAGGTSTFTWFNAERLTSGVRDANRPEAVCVKGAGCVVTWQEDPDGIRPGEGEGPGEGWSGAIAHHQTDTWYSYISWNNFDQVGSTTESGDYTIVPIGEYVGETAPQAGIPFAMPVRLSDNAMCKAEGSDPYCYADFDGSGIADFCESSVSVTLETPEGGTQIIDMCVAEDGRLMRGNTAATRARINLHGYSTSCLYDPANPDTCPVDSAWFTMAYEESKGLGEEGEDETTPEDLIEKVDMGKNVWYHTFDMFNPEVASQGLMLNQPAVYQEDFNNPEGFLTQYIGLTYNFYQIDPDPVYETLAGIDTTLLQSEIARRPSPITQDWYDAGASGTVALQLWKQGIIRRGGPADIMGRRFVMPVGDGESHDAYEYCATEYQYLTTTYDYLTITQECHWEEQWVEDYGANPAYDYHPSCNGRPTQLRCYPFIDLDGNPTYDAGIYVNVEVCVDVETWEPVESCNVEDPNCREATTLESVDECDVEDESCITETTCELVDYCDTSDPNCTVTQVSEPAIDPSANPYDYANMECVNPDGSSGWAFTDGTNPRYVKGLCAAPAINLSGNTVLTGECSDATACLTAFPFNEYFDDYQGGEGGTPAQGISKIWTWQQYGPGFGETITDTTLTNLDDVSWENPYDVAKGHRGFMSGDMIMAIYAWSPNWLANTVGHDNYNLYVRRSFDGGRTWSTLPASFTHTDGVTYAGDGTTTCEWMGPTGSENEYPVCVDYTAGEFEQARNLSQLVGTRETILDPRYSPTTRSITEASVTTASLPAGFTAPLYPDDTRDPSRFFIVYETGDNTTVAFGEAEPLDLFYSRAVNWGDDYLVWQDEVGEACLPWAENEELAGFCNEFEALEGSALDESGEASITASPGGQFYYAIWNQIDFDRSGDEIGSDAWFRRVLFLDDYVPPEKEANQ